MESQTFNQNHFTLKKRSRRVLNANQISLKRLKLPSSICMKVEVVIKTSMWYPIRRSNQYVGVVYCIPNNIPLIQAPALSCSSHAGPELGHFTDMWYKDLWRWFHRDLVRGKEWERNRLQISRSIFTGPWIFHVESLAAVDTQMG